MPELMTKALGKIEITPMQIVRFPEGLYGFRDYTEFALLEEREESIFKWLQSTDEQSLAFVLIQADLFAKGYVPDVSKAELESLEVDNVAECVVFCIVTIPENNPEEMTANLQGPVLINGKNKIGRQVISNNSRHSVRTPILQQLEG